MSQFGFLKTPQLCPSPANHIWTRPLLVRCLLVCCVLSVAGVATAQHAASELDITESDPKAAATLEAGFLGGTRQLTFAGRRAGEGYFSADGSQLVFQSEREAGNPFYQIYVMDLETGDTERVSPGFGKTTCAWIHPTGQKVLFASTQDDPQAKQKQKAELDFRASGQERRYAWDYDNTHELYEYDRKAKTYRRLTNELGYDAEGSWSPDGKLIAFTSNRQAYEGNLTAEEQKNFELDPAYLNEIYIMNADGSNVRRLTTTAGYDGGPFFSPNGMRICWRRFTPNGAIAEVWSMNVDGTDKRQLTRLGAMSWAPYYHPSGEYLIFTTNKHGFGNFELYLVDVDGKSKPVRVSHTAKFDGLPVFTPDGKQLAWTCQRGSSGKSQIFLADWNHEHAMKSLGLDGSTTGDQRTEADASALADARENAAVAKRAANAGFKAQDALRHVDYLCRKELLGRLTGSSGERQATAYVAAYLDSLGVKPAGDEGGWFQKFTFTSGVALEGTNQLASQEQSYLLNQDWRPLSFSGNGEFPAAPLTFAGYGMRAPKSEQHAEYDSFVHLDVKGKWVIVFRYLPENVPAEQRQHLSRASQIRFKATVARDLGAAGLIVVTGPTAKAKSELVPLRLDGILAGTSLPVISVTNDVAQAWFAANGKDLKSLQEQLDTGEPMMGFDLNDVELSAQIAVKRNKASGQNVLGRLQVGTQPSEQVVVVGAHIDHLGKGANSSSLATDDESEGIHVGADDNASGVSAMLEIAEYLSDQLRRGKLNAQRDVLFAAWSGEELGLLGSDHFVKNYGMPAHGMEHGHTQGHGVGHTAPSGHALPPAHQLPAGHKLPPVGHQLPPAGHKLPPVSELKAAEKANLHAGGHAHAALPTGIYPSIAACINMDMVGRLEKNLILQGIGSSSIWRSEIERRNAPVGLSITLQEDSYLPTDASSFYKQGVPILSAFTGSHGEYHTPRDTPDRLNYEGVADIAKLMGLITRSLIQRETPPDFVEQEMKQQQTRGRMRAFLGTVPDYAEEVKGVLLSGARKGGPAAEAGVRARDIIVELAGKNIENIYDYTHAIEALKIGEKVELVVLRQGKRVTLEVTPGSRE